MTTTMVHMGSVWADELAAFVDVLRPAMRQASALLLPVDCAGCGAADVDVCDACRHAMNDVLDERGVIVRTTGGVRVHSVLQYDEAPTAAVIAALKEHGRTSLALVLAPLLLAALRDVVVSVGAAPDVAIVPIPSTRSAVRRRGYRPVPLLLEHAGVSATALLRVRGRPEDQRVLSAAERASNVSGAFSVRARRAVDIDSCVIVDDVVTTGSTIRAAAAALTTAGVRVLGAATVAQTPKRRRW